MAGCGRTALHWAAKRGDSALAAVLISFKASLDEVDDGGNTPLMVAADEATFSLLLPNAKTLSRRHSWVVAADEAYHRNDGHTPI